MSTRLQVVVSEQELAEMKAVARSARMTLSEWVRQALREARDAGPAGPDRHELERVLATAAGHAFPAPDIGQINAEIEAGYLER
ncbi:antitoxin [Euzebya tangerina]|uniref:antitoxin n=1 Tax=Euzebya tangerina TaxID=591198 RepID=UPI000E3242F4|nr:antitoxin [Euzebya tangerina]